MNDKSAMPNRGRVPVTGTVRILIGILCCAAVLRIASLCFFHPPVLSDDIEYDALARSMASGHGFSIDGTPFSYRTPGYPVLIAACYFVFGVDPAPVRAVQILCDLASCCFLYALGKRLFNPRTGLLAAGVFAFLPQQILYVSHLMSETFFTTLLLAMMWLVVRQGSSFRWRESLLLGILLGAATLVRPVVLLIPVVWIVYWRWNTVSWKPIAQTVGLTALAAALLIAPWMWRNNVLFSHFSLTSNSGVNLWIGHHDGANGSYSYPSTNENPLYAVADDYERSALGTTLALEYIRSRPLQEVVLSAKKVAHFFENDYWLLTTMYFMPEWKEHRTPVLVYSKLPLSSLLLMQLPFIVVTLLAVYGTAFADRRDAPALLIIAGTLFYWLILHIAFYANARYRFPVNGMIILLGAYGYGLVRSHTAVRSRIRGAVFAALILVLVGGWCAEGYTLWKKHVEAGLSFNALRLPESPDRADVFR